jgi:hypothetical protein
MNYLKDSSHVSSFHQFNNTKYLSKRSHLPSKFHTNDEPLDHINYMLNQLQIASENHRRLIEERFVDTGKILQDVEKRRLESRQPFLKPSTGSYEHKSFEYMENPVNYSTSRENVQNIQKAEQLKLLLIQKRFGEVSCESVSHRRERLDRKLERIPTIQHQRYPTWGRKSRLLNNHSSVV